jgi:hypothetical protein
LSKCICKGNWRKIVQETEPLIGKTFLDNRGKPYVLFGIVHGGDDYYYGMCSIPDFTVELLSCVGSIKTAGFTLDEG